MKDPKRSTTVMRLEINENKLADNGISLVKHEDKTFFEIHLTSGPIFHEEYTRYLQTEVDLTDMETDELYSEVTMFVARKAICKAIR